MLGCKIHEWTTGPGVLKPYNNLVGTLDSLVRQIDHLGLHTPLPFAETYFPLGFRAEIATNSRDVVEAAEESWNHWGPRFRCEPIRLRILVHPEGELCPTPTHRMQGHLYSVVADAHNFAHVDVAAQFGLVQVSQKTAADHVWLRWFFVESLVYMLLAQRYVAAAHAACVALNGSGVLLCGPSGTGKSTLSYACAREGWTFITDDCTFLLANSDQRVAIGKPRQARFRLDSPELFPELRPYSPRVRPTGKVGIEVPLAELPHIRTAETAPIARIVLLERGPGTPCAIPVTGDEAVARVLADMPSYGDEVDAMHERTVRRLAEVAAYRLRYERLADAIRMLAELTGA
jgi:hypothetical protein